MAAQIVADINSETSLETFGDLIKKCQDQFRLTLKDSVVKVRLNLDSDYALHYILIK